MFYLFASLETKPNNPTPLPREHTFAPMNVCVGRRWSLQDEDNAESDSAPPRITLTIGWTCLEQKRYEADLTFENSPFACLHLSGVHSLSARQK